ncbi:twitching motility protein [Chthoniobacter flavus Ellin428]|uniref:Twitching motility protein n=1 Tax=Chthoniobacter flavus Ellin428 TaxID=497964 RepID=B4D9Q0_9BACT|nr:PilT/PilU family type 4a pilus ATPase [Chthoniobacter flavus]EDY16831.1 twitching motility protein [Chthoniobacter flavus Ellin428]TCO93346.1 twitching motility protein PilT [Chthoniobacter flavus]
MRQPELDAVLGAMLDTHPGISDLVFSVGRPLQVESFGELKEAVIANPAIRKLTHYQTEQLALTIIGNQRHLLRDLVTRGACDCSYALQERARFRVNIFRQRGNFAIIMRKGQSEMPSLNSLGLTPIFKDMAKEKNGLILVTGATGSGKTTTLSALLNEINETMAVHVVTLEDPIEYIHQHKKATFNQRELGADFDAFPNGLRSALRQAPKVILVGEMRDRATVEIALTAAETGHLVLSTIHTINAGQSINRILGMFDLAEETQLRLRLSETLRYVVSQRLAPKVNGGRIMVNEIMGSNLRTREAVALGEAEGRSFYEIIEANATFGWTTFDQSIARAYQAGLVTEDTANLYATNKARMTRYIDGVKKQRGLENDTESGLKLDLESTTHDSYINLRMTNK